MKQSETWRPCTGLRIATPFFGRLEKQPNIVYGHGYCGNGVGPSYTGAKFLASLALVVPRACLVRNDGGTRLIIALGDGEDPGPLADLLEGMEAAGAIPVLGPAESAATAIGP